MLGRYQACVDMVKGQFSVLYNDELCFNSGGSTTYTLYPEGQWGPLNELALGSGFVKPTDFDLETLSGHQPAAFIATPVIKASDHLQVPLLEKLSSYWAKISPNMARSFFIYGGWWKARPVSPEGLFNHACMVAALTRKCSPAPKGRDWTQMILFSCVRPRVNMYSCSSAGFW